MKIVKIKTEAQLKDYEFQKVISVLIDYIQTKEVCLSIILLNERLVDNIEISFDNISIFLKLSSDNESRFSTFDSKKGIFKGTVSKNSLEYIIHFLLKYYRDQFGEAEHIDVDFVNEQNSIVTLTVKVASFKEYSFEEMNKLLGM
jgi:hypothetical protein